MKISILILIFTKLITICRAQIELKTNYIILSLNANQKVSTYVQYLLNYSAFRSGMSVTSEYKIDNIKGDEGTGTVAVDINKQNGDIATDVLALKEIYKNDEYVSNKEYYINYTYSKNRMHSNPKLSTYNYENEDNYNIRCNYTSNDLKYITSMIDQPNLLSFVTYSYITFAIYKNTSGVKIISYYNNSLWSESFDNFLSADSKNVSVNNTQFEKISIINQVYLDTAQVVLHKSEDNSIMFYNINISESQFTLSFFTQMNYTDINSTQISKIGIFQEHYLVGTLDKGLLILEKESGEGIYSKWKPFLILNKNNSTNVTISVKDFVVNEKTIYLINKDSGMMIIELNNNYTISAYFFAHPKLENIDFINNPFFGSKYIGVSVTNGNEINEFFIEFLIDNEFHPLLNKVFTASELVLFDNFYTVDKFFTYIFNKISNNLMIIRRGMINTIPSELYQLDLSPYAIKQNFRIGKTQMTSFYNKEKNQFFPAIYGGYQILLIHYIEFTPDTLICNFQKAGLYNITLFLQGEMCKNSIDSDYLYTSCDKEINFTYYIYADSTDSSTAIIVGVSCFWIVFISLVMAYIFWKTKCCKDFDYFRTETEIIGREDMYRENNGGQEELIDNKGVESEYQLGTVYNGKILGNVVENSDIQNDKNDYKVDIHTYNVEKDKINNIGTRENMVINNDKRKSNIEESERNLPEYNNSKVYITDQRLIPRPTMRKKVNKGPEKINLNAENIMVLKKEESRNSLNSNEIKSTEKDDKIPRESEIKHAKDNISTSNKISDNIRYSQNIDEFDHSIVELDELRDQENHKLKSENRNNFDIEPNKENKNPEIKKEESDDKQLILNSNLKENEEFDFDNKEKMILEAHKGDQFINLDN